MFTPTLKTATNRCTKWCTEVRQLALTTLFWGEQTHRMPLKMLAVEIVNWPVAPNVAGSIPVSHPNWIFFLIWQPRVVLQSFVHAAISSAFNKKRG